MKYSFKDFTDKNLLKVPVEELNNTTIQGSCFYQQGEPDQKVFPDDVKGLILEDCNLDNVFIPSGATVVRGTNKRLKVQNDKHIWIVDKDNKPLEPLRKKEFQELGLSIKPVDIPKEKLSESIIEKNKKEIEEKKRSDSKYLEELRKDGFDIKSITKEKIFADKQKLEAVKGG